MKDKPQSPMLLCCLTLSWRCFTNLEDFFNDTQCSSAVFIHGCVFSSFMILMARDQRGAYVHFFLKNW